MERCVTRGADCVRKVRSGADNSSRKIKKLGPESICLPNGHLFGSFGFSKLPFFLVLSMCIFWAVRPLSLHLTTVFGQECDH